MSDELINAAGASLQAIRLDGEDVLITFGAHSPSFDCQNGHVSAEIRRRGDTAVGEGTTLSSAIAIARAKLNQQAAKREAAKAAGETA